VLRFWNTDVVEDLERVSWTILKACRESAPGRQRAKLARR
jgi:very-short-patch-repair endonuclease